MFHKINRMIFMKYGVVVIKYEAQIEGVCLIKCGDGFLYRVFLIKPEAWGSYYKAWIIGCFLLNMKHGVVLIKHKV